MAIIQDLPPELLYRILELMTGSQVFSLEQAKTRRSFARTTLVAQSWRAPSQYLLASTLRTNTETALWKGYLKAAPDRSNLHSTVQYLEVGGPKGAADELALLQQRGIAVQELAIYTAALCLNSSHVRLLQGVRQLTLRHSIKLDTNLGKTKLMLEALRVLPGLHELPDFILPLSTFAPRLSRLTLNTWSSPLPDSFNASLQDIAPQLRHLRLERELSLPLQGDGFDLDRFLSACTSLTSLQLDTATPASVQHILFSTRPPLSLLNVDLSLLSLKEEDELMTVHLAGVFDQPCMAKLKRWRMSGSVNDALGGRREISESAMEEWRSACRERGIEPRGQERFFTD